jgi:hypothetical protein
MAAAPKIDYARIEPAWRAGIKSVQQLAADYTKEVGVSVSHVSILKHFKSRGIPRDLNAKIQAAAQAKVTAAMVTEKATRASEPVIIEANATAVATIHLTQRSDISKARSLSMKLMRELEGQVDNPDLVESLVDALRQDEGDGSTKRLEMFTRLTSLGAHTKTMKELADTLRTLIALEREAYGIDRLPDTAPPAEEFDPIDTARRIAFVLARADHMLAEQEAVVH